MNKWTNRKISISKRYTAKERKAIAFEIISYIQDRTKDGLGKDGKKWRPPADKYTKDYKESQDFKMTKGRSSTVDLTLSGDMLNSIDLLKSAKGELRIGVKEGDEDHGKAEGNIRGSYGKPTGSKKKSRDFLAISQEEVNDILKDFPIEDEKKRKESTLAYGAALAAAKQLIPSKTDRRRLTIGELILGKKEI